MNNKKIVIVVGTFILILLIGGMAIERRNVYYGLNVNSNYKEIKETNIEKINNIEKEIIDIKLHNKNNIDIEKNEVLEVWKKMLENLKTNI